MYIYGAMLVVALALRWVRLRASRHSLAVVQYLHGLKVEAEAGPSLLEVSRLSDLPHANLCRGRGRCGTCRVRIVDAPSGLSEPTKMERKTLTRLNAPNDVRLACQFHPQAGNLTVERLVSPYISPRDMVLNQKAEARLATAGTAVPEGVDA